MIVDDYETDPYSGKETGRVICVWQDLIHNEQRGIYPEAGLIKLP